MSLLATVEESVLLVEDDGVEDVSLDATEPEALPLNEPDAELGELVLPVEEPLVLLLGSLLATREESELVEDEAVSLDVELLLARLESLEERPVGERLSDDVAPELIAPDADVDELEELGVWLARVSELLVEALLVLLAVVSLEEALPAPDAEPLAPNEPLEDGDVLVELSLFVIEVLCEELLEGCEDVVSTLPDAELAPFKPNVPEVVDVLAELVVSELATFALLLAFELLIVEFWL